MTAGSAEKGLGLTNQDPRFCRYFDPSTREFGDVSRSRSTVRGQGKRRRLCSRLNPPLYHRSPIMNYGKKDEDADSGLVKVDRTQVFQEGKSPQTKGTKWTTTS